MVSWTIDCEVWANGREPTNHNFGLRKAGVIEVSGEEFASLNQQVFKSHSKHLSSMEFSLKAT